MQFSGGVHRSRWPRPEFNYRLPVEGTEEIRVGGLNDWRGHWWAPVGGLVLLDSYIQTYWGPVPSNLESNKSLKVIGGCWLVKVTDRVFRP